MFGITGATKTHPSSGRSSQPARGCEGLRQLLPAPARLNHLVAVVQQFSGHRGGTRQHLGAIV
eukprot:5094549-Pyramimonas_sp.AAC.1